MSGPQVALVGVDEWDAAIDAWVDRIERATEDGLRAAGQSVADETPRSFGSDGGPTSRSGALAASVVVTDPRKTDSGYELEVGPTGLMYVRKVELGKAGTHSGPPYPYFRPAYDRAGERFVTVIQQAWADAAPRGGD